MTTATQSDDVLTAIAERCKERELKPQCTKCERTLASMRQSGEGLPVLMMADGPMCTDCRVGRPVAQVVPQDGLRTLPAYTRTGTPRITLAKSGSLGINRATCDYYEFPAEGHLVFAWDAGRGRLYIGLGEETQDGARAYKRKDDGKGAIQCSVKSLIKMHCRLDFDHVQEQAPYTPQYDEKTGTLYVEIG
jgi:hypothetical protein